MTPKKKKTRDREVARWKLRTRERRQYIVKYPALKLVGLDGPAEVLEMVGKAIHRFRFDDGVHFGPLEQKAYRLVKTAGFSTAQRALEAAGMKPYVAMNTLLLHPMEVLYLTMPQGDLEHALAYSDIWALPNGDCYHIGVRSMRSAPGPGGTIYFNPREPRISFEGKEYIVGFSRHAIERLFDRTGHAWRTFGGHGDVFTLVYDYVGFEVVELPSGQLGVTMFDACAAEYLSARYVTEVIGSTEGIDVDRYEYRLGYLPMVLSGDFAVCTTFLPPGYRGTPEHALLCNMVRDRKAERALLESLERFIPWPGMPEAHWKVTRSFHENGLPQVQRAAAERIRYRMKTGAPAAAVRRSGF